MPIPAPTPAPAAYRGSFPHGETVEVLTAGQVVDPYSGEPSDAWALAAGETWEVEPAETPVSGVGVEPRPSTEPIQDARNSTTSGFTLYLPEMPLTPKQRVRVRGGVYNVLGEPARWVNPFTGWAPGLVVQVDRTEG